jgi:hypothetical protein
MWVSMGNLYFNLLNVNHAIYAKMLKQLIKKMRMKCGLALHGMTT